MFQHEGSAVEGGLGSKLIVPAGNKVGLFPLVELAAEDDGPVRVVDGSLSVRVAVKRKNCLTV